MASEDKIENLIQLFEQERARHREAEIAAESRIRLLETKLKDLERKEHQDAEDKRNSKQTIAARRGSNTAAATTASVSPSSSSTAVGRRVPTPKTSSTAARAQQPRTASSPAASSSSRPTTPKRTTTPTASRDTVRGTTPRTADNLHAATPNKQHQQQPQPRVRRVAGSPEGSPSGVDALQHASAARSSRSERLAAARAKRLESGAAAASSAGTARSTSGRPKSAGAGGSKKSGGGGASSAARSASSPAANTAKSNGGKSGGGNNPLQEQAWNKFCAQAKEKFTPAELVAISSETLQQLMDHFGTTGAVERARIEAHWAHLNAPQDAAATTAAGGGGATPTTPRRAHAPPVKELKFPEHPADFDLRTNVLGGTVEQISQLTPRTLLRPEAPRGCNIDSHAFSSGVRTDRTLTLLRTRSPATGAPDFHLQAQIPAHLQQKVNSKKILEAQHQLLQGQQEERPQAKRMFDRVPGADAADRAEGKKRVQSAAAAASSSADDVDGKKHSKRIAQQRPGESGRGEEQRCGLKIKVRDPAESRDAVRYMREQSERDQPRLVTDSTLSTPTMKKLAAQQQQQQQPGAARRLPPQQAAASAASRPPSAFQLKTPFAVDA